MMKNKTTPNSKKYDIIIIGAGSVGVPLSYYLSKKKVKVAVIEKKSSVGRGQNRAAIGGMRATHSDPAKIEIGLETLKIMRNMKADYGYDVDWIQGGYLFPVYEQTDEIKLKKILETQKNYGLRIDWISKENVRKIVPGINSNNLLGGTFSPEDGSASPLKTIDAFYMLAKGNGVDFYFNEELVEAELSNGKVDSIKTTERTFQSDLIVDCSGGDAREVGKIFGMELPVYPESHEGGITEPVERFFEPMIVDMRPAKGSANYYFYQNIEGQIVFCITPNPNIPGKDCDNTSIFLPQVIERMLNLYPRLRNIRVRRTWRGLYPMTPDGFPIVGYSGKVKNLFLSVGMCGQGFMLGPGLGKILSEILVDNSKDYEDLLENLKLDRSYDTDEVLK
ncbi:MAG: FAD-binding oxidoreductase [Candidatus Marinimicrobia bacterium]|nr:FAD-binding oxidoreductase [Candidatus Neomarinimicrobiota bacterium]